MKCKTALLALCATLAATASIAEVIPGTDLDMQMQAAQVQTSGRTVSLFRIPIKDRTSGVTTYFDASFDFGLMPDGSVGFTRTSSAQLTSSQEQPADQFIAGTYKDGGGRTYIVSGPGRLTGGRLSYSIQDTAGSFNASWITGTVAGHPVIGSMPLTSQPAEGSGGGYGILGGNSYYSSIWLAGCAITASQSGATGISISIYSANSQCAKTPAASMTFVRQ